MSDTSNSRTWWVMFYSHTESRGFKLHSVTSEKILRWVLSPRHTSLVDQLLSLARVVYDMKQHPPLCQLSLHVMNLLQCGKLSMTCMLKHFIVFTWNLCQIFLIVCFSCFLTKSCTPIFCVLSTYIDRSLFFVLAFWHFATFMKLFMRKYYKGSAFTSRVSVQFCICSQTGAMIRVVYTRHITCIYTVFLFRLLFGLLIAIIVIAGTTARKIVSNFKTDF